LLKLHKRGRRERGQTLILVTIALPLFLALMSLVVDGGNILVHKRNIQVAADAAALAAARDLASRGVGTCDATCLASVQSSAQDYSQRNGGSNNLPQCSSTVTTNCFTTPYTDQHGVTHDDQVEVRLTQHVTTFLGGLIGIYSANVSARAVASGSAIFGTTTVPGTVIHGTTFVTTIAGSTHTTTDMTTLAGGSGVAFTMSRVCDSIFYSGAGSGTWDDAVASGLPGSASVLGVFVTNGGVNFQGTKPKKLTTLGFDQPRCVPLHDPDSPPSGDPSQCTARAWNTPAGSGTDSNNMCVQNLVNLNSQNTLPLNWPFAPPAEPAPKGGPWNPSTDYASRCINLGNKGTITFSVDTQPAGIYCVTGSGTTLQINGAEPAGSDGHTFFALGGATISLSSNSTSLKFYWPSACGPRPTARSSSFSCFGRTISGYDSMTVLYATYASADGNCAVCLQGQNGTMVGDIFATKPDIFPPILTQTGGIVKVAGGALSAGRGFIESWNLQISGNTGTYQGTGFPIVITGTTHTTTDPGTVSTLVTPDTTTPSTVEVTTVGTGITLTQ
jgi:Flp pilus assembly protein TadG